MFDLLIKSGRIIGGTGSKSFIGDIAVNEGLKIIFQKTLPTKIFGR